MFETTQRKTSTSALAMNTLAVAFYVGVRKVRQSHANAVVAVVLSVFQGAVFVLAFFFMFSLLGTRGSAIRGDFLLYLLSGIFLYLTHIRGVMAIMGSESSTSALMQHAPMNTLVAILSSGLSSLYLQMTSVLIILLAMHTLLNPVEIYYWPGALFMFILSWFSGCVMGLIMASLKPWIPDLIAMIQMVYIRANMIFSGKMFVANAMPNFLLPFFIWNPLFHIIDQTRGFVFVNYFPHKTNWEYPFYFSIVMLVIGFMGEFYTRKHASASWNAKR